MIGVEWIKLGRLGILGVFASTVIACLLVAWGTAESSKSCGASNDQSCFHPYFLAGRSKVEAESPRRRNCRAMRFPGASHCYKPLYNSTILGFAPSSYWTTFRDGKRILRPLKLQALQFDPAQLICSSPPSKTKTYKTIRNDSQGIAPLEPEAFSGISEEDQKDFKELLHELLQGEHAEKFRAFYDEAKKEQEAREEEGRKLEEKKVKVTPEFALSDPDPKLEEYAKSLFTDLSKFQEDNNRSNHEDEANTAQEENLSKNTFSKDELNSADLFPAVPGDEVLATDSQGNDPAQQDEDTLNVKEGEVDLVKSRASVQDLYQMAWFTVLGEVKKLQKSLNFSAGALTIIAFILWSLHNLAVCSLRASAMLYQNRGFINPPTRIEKISQKHGSSFLWKETLEDIQIMLPVKNDIRKVTVSCQGFKLRIALTQSSSNGNAEEEVLLQGKMKGRIEEDDICWGIIRDGSFKGDTFFGNFPLFTQAPNQVDTTPQSLSNSEKNSLFVKTIPHDEASFHCKDFLHVICQKRKLYRYIWKKLFQ